MGKKHTHTKPDFKIASDYSVIINGFKLPKGALYGTYYDCDTPFKYACININTKPLEIYIYTPWKTWELLLLNDNNQFCAWFLSKINTLPKNHVITWGMGCGIVTTFQRDAIRHGKISALKDANKRHLSRHDNNDFIRNQSGEIEYNYKNTYKKTKAYN